MNILKLYTLWIHENAVHCTMSDFYRNITGNYLLVWMECSMPLNIKCSSYIEYVHAQGFTGIEYTNIET